MAGKYEHLFTPLQIGKITVKNRYAVGAMGGRHFIYTDKGAYSRNGIEYWVERAKGGFGLIMTGSNVANLTVDPFDKKNGNPNPLVNPSYFGAAAREVLDRVHYYGGKMFMQVSMGPGRMRDGKSCSAIPKFKDPSKLTEELTKEEIAEKVADMAKLSAYAKKCGYDGVEIHGMHWGYLLDQFAMAYTNHRTDEYGGDLDGRLLIHKQIIRAIKEACGEDFPVSFRMCIKAYMGGYNVRTLDGSGEVGRTIEEAIEIAKRFEEWGVDMLNVNTGTYDTFYYCVGPYYMPKGYNIELAAQLKAAVNIPVFLAGKMDDPDMCEKAVAEGKIDGVTLARASLVDAEYPNKVFRGQVERIRPCIACTNCIESNLATGYVMCSADPAAMHHYNNGIRPAIEPKKVVVVGGGVTGMEAARTAKLCGHKVELYERDSVLGGHLLEAGAHPFKQGIADLCKWYENELTRLGVPVHLGQALDAEAIKALAPDAVILAVGSDHFIPRIEGVNHEKCVSCRDILIKNKKAGDEVVIVGGGLTGCELAYDLAAVEGKKVTLVEGLNDIMSSGPAVPMAVNTMLRDLLAKYGVTIRTGRMISAVNDEGAVVKDREGNLETIKADQVIMAIGLRPRKDMTDELREAGIEVYKAGDGARVGNIRSCTATAYEVARNL